MCRRRMRNAKPLFAIANQISVDGLGPFYFSLQKFVLADQVGNLIEQGFSNFIKLSFHLIDLITAILLSVIGMFNYFIHLTSQFLFEISQFPSCFLKIIELPLFQKFVTLKLLMLNG